MNQKFCYLVAWILELHWIGCLLQTRHHGEYFLVFSYFVFTLYIQRSWSLKTCPRTPGGP